MIDSKKIKEIDMDIRKLRSTADDLAEKGKEIETVKRNIRRIQASIRMLELNICDIIDIIR